jgi:hypothetical protein
MGAYNYATLPTGKLPLPNSLRLDSLPDIKPVIPKLLAMATAQVYTKPLNTGDSIGSVEMGSEYPYMGHIQSGWIKVRLPNGKVGWTSTHFEYIKNDFTQVDTLAVDLHAGPRHFLEKKTLRQFPVITLPTQKGHIQNKLPNLTSHHPGKGTPHVD